jgi:hypothetical protein
MLLILGFAESSDAPEPMFAYEGRKVPLSHCFRRERQVPSPRPVLP